MYNCDLRDLVVDIVFFSFSFSVFYFPLFDRNLLCSDFCHVKCQENTIKSDEMTMTLCYKKLSVWMKIITF